MALSGENPILLNGNTCFMVGTYDVEALESLAVMCIHISNEANEPVGYRAQGNTNRRLVGFFLNTTIPMACLCA